MAPAMTAAFHSARRTLSGTSRLPEDVSRAADRVDQPWLTLRLQLGAQVADVHLDDVCRALEVRPPDRVQDCVPRQYVTGMFHEVLEQLELRRGQRDLTVAAARRP